MTGRTVDRGLAVLFIVAALAIGTLAGALVGSTRFSPPLQSLHSGTASGPSGQLTLVAAGTLDSLFPTVASQLGGVYPAVEVSNSTQEYMGSLSAVRQITSLNRFFDLIGTVDPRQIPTYMYPAYADWEACFASNPVALVYSPSSRFASVVNGTNWSQVILNRGTLVGAANASTDPNGYNAIFALQLAGLKLYGGRAYIFDHFYVNGSNGVARPNPATNALRIAPETQADALLRSGAVDFYFTYVSYAVAHGLDYVNLGPWANLGQFNATYWDFYKQVHTNVIGPNGKLATIYGGPVVDCVTIPKNSPNPTLAEYFLLFLVSSQGQADMKSIGLSVIFPEYVDNASAVPPLLQPFSTAMPSQLLSGLG